MLEEFKSLKAHWYREAKTLCHKIQQWLVRKFSLISFIKIFFCNVSIFQTMSPNL